MISRLKNTAAASAAVEEIKQLRREYEANFGKHLMKAPAGTTLPQSDLDWKRGFYEGLLWGWTTFLENSGPRLARLEKAMAADKE